MFTHGVDKDRAVGPRQVLTSRILVLTAPTLSRARAVACNVAPRPLSNYRHPADQWQEASECARLGPA